MGGPLVLATVAYGVTGAVMLGRRHRRVGAGAAASTGVGTGAEVWRVTALVTRPVGLHAEPAAG